MPIEVKCASCQKRLRVPDKAAGKKIKCPGCESIIVVPADDEEPTVSITPKTKTPAKSSAAAGSGSREKSAAKSKPAEMWRVKIDEDGDEYGPIDRAELDEWVAEGRLHGDCQLLQDGHDQWQWASDVYPELDEQAGDDEDTAEDNPFAFGDAAPGASAGPGMDLAVGSGKGKQSVAKTSHAAHHDDDELSPRDRLGAGLLGIFAGAWGVHSFYLGNTTKGIIQIIVTICTCFMGGIWGMVEGFLILGGSIDRDSEGRKLRN